MSLPLHDRAVSGDAETLVRMTGTALADPEFSPEVVSLLIPQRSLEAGEQFRFHFNMTKCIGCRSCEVACNEQNGNPANIHWRRVGEIEGGVYPLTERHYLSIGCNHCLDADCLKGCPVDAYTKDPLTGIVLHSADACIGCQYCVWNCPYSVPQFNEERGVVGKCDMCHGRLTDGLEPACVNACPEAAIEIEIVNMASWREDYAAAESPGMPAASQTLSTTRITLPQRSAAKLERVDGGRVRPEHAHLSLVFMTALMQCAAGALILAATFHSASPLLLVFLLGITTFALNISIFHLGRPAYAWRALKMWRRSWLSREVLLFGLFFGALTASTAAACWNAYHPGALILLDLRLLLWSAVTLGLAGVTASAFIYLVAARPAWNMVHTPVDFVLSAGLLGATALPVLLHLAAWAQNSLLHRSSAPSPGQSLARVTAAVTFLWLGNQALRIVRLNRSPLFEGRASASLLNTVDLRAVLITAFAGIVSVPILSLNEKPGAALAMSALGILLTRYLFFVTVVPLNMALTFVRAEQR